MHLFFFFFCSSSSHYKHLIVRSFFFSFHLFTSLSLILILSCQLEVTKHERLRFLF